MKKVKQGLLFIFLLLANISCGKKEEKKDLSIGDIKDLQTRQYAVKGQVLYERLCANCHQQDGSGLVKLIPPLAGSDFMDEDIGRTIRIIKFGLHGEIEVNGVLYNQPMPPNPQLSPLEISEISTYIYNVWGNKKGLVSPETVRKHLQN